MTNVLFMYERIGESLYGTGFSYIPVYTYIGGKIGFLILFSLPEMCIKNGFDCIAVYAECTAEVDRQESNTAACLCFRYKTLNSWFFS